MTLGEAFTIRFNQLLEEKGISLHKFVKDNCIARSTIVNILKGNTKVPSLSVIYQVANGFNMTYLQFLDCESFKSEEIDYLS